MAREFFKNLPDTTTPLNAQRMNAFLNGEEAMGSIVVDDISCKNKLNASAPTNSTVTSWSGNGSTYYLTANSAWQKLEWKIEAKAGEEYTFSYKARNSNALYLYIAEYDASGNKLKSIVGDNVNITNSFTVENDCILLISFQNNAVISNVAIEEPQLEKGLKKTTFTPYKKYGYNSQESMGKIIVDDITSKNIFDNQWLPLGKRYSNNSSSAFATTTAENNVGILNPIKLDRSKRYFYLYTNSSYTTNGIYFYDENGIWTGDRTFTNPNAVITIPETAYYMTFNIQGVTDINDLKSYEWMIEYVDSPTSTHTGYAPYKEISDKKTIISETIRKVNGQGTLVNGSDCATLGELISLVLKSDDKIRCSVGNTSTSAVKDVLGNPNIGNYVYAITEIIYFEGLNAMIRVIAHALYGNVVKTGYLLRDNVSDQWTGWQ